MKELRGSMVALVTPFKNQKVDLNALARLVDFHAKNGTSAVVPCGTTGESPTLSHKEHQDVIRATVEAADGRLLVIAGTGSNCTDEAVTLTRFAKKAGADACLSVVPYYNKPTQEGLIRHFTAIAVKGSLPVVLYNIPGRSGVALLGDSIAKLARIEEIVAIKEATGSMDVASEILTRTDLTVLSGDDSLTLPLLALGARGVISVVANLVPEDVALMIRLFEEDDLSEARKIHRQLFPLVKALFLETNPIPVKAAMQMLRMDTGEIRLPLCPMSRSNRDVLKRRLKAYLSASTAQGYRKFLGSRRVL
ncbi:MAG: 4-hydroxy-tetrahydrodipicolinate synthase, partial [Candidatus Omnitrophica bacterium]|nr:4-hydroxy-tetrahydrodipicolinate synthase [Candidatus Omnitrophota bacterium]